MESVDTHIIITGGTFDKGYNPLNGELEFSKSNIEAILRQARFRSMPKLSIPFLVDSLNMTEAQRQEVVDLATETSATNLVITHGTDTMIETAKSLDSKKLDKTIVLTGAMVPYNLTNSDATFNLGFAHACCQTLPPGVYIAMQGEIFTPNHCLKNKAKGVFESLNPQ